MDNDFYPYGPITDREPTTLDQALRYATEHPDGWVTTGDEIADHYSRATGPVRESANIPRDGR